MTCSSGPPWRPGNTCLSTSLPRGSWGGSTPPRGPRRGLGVVVVAICACGTGEGWIPAATSPATCAMSTMKIADEVGAIFIVDMAHVAGLVAAGIHPSPVPHAQIATTTTPKPLRGPRGGVDPPQEPLGKDVDKQVFPGLQGGPLEHVIAAKAVALAEALTPEFKTYATQVVRNAQALAAALVELGYAIVSGGTDTHLMLVDLRPKQVTGKEAQELLDRAGITVNKNTIPGDPQKAFVTSGIRIGTPAVTTRGFTEAEMLKVAEVIDTVLTKKDDATIARVKAEVRELTEQFPLYAPPARAAVVGGHHAR